MDDELAVLLELTSVIRAMTTSVDRSLGEYHGIALRDLELLLELQRAPKHHLQLSEIAAKLGIASSDVARLLGPLERIGVVERSRNPIDPRQAVASLTEAGDTLV